MSLTRRFRSLFPALIRERGEFYHRDGRVRVETRSHDTARAVVRGNEDYVVEARWDSLRLSATCTCIYFDDYGLCKHVWAALLALDEAPPAARALPWRKRLTPPPASRDEPPLDWPAGREAVYILSPGARGAGAAQLSLHCRDRKKNGDWTVLKDWRPRLGQIAELPDDADRECLTLLAGGRGGASHTYYGGSAALDQVFELPPALARMLLPKLAQRGPRRPNDLDTLEVEIDVAAGSLLMPGMRVDTYFRIETPPPPPAPAPEPRAEATTAPSVAPGAAAVKSN